MSFRSPSFAFSWAARHGVNPVSCFDGSVFYSFCFPVISSMFSLKTAVARKMALKIPFDGFSEASTNLSVSIRNTFVFLHPFKQLDFSEKINAFVSRIEVAAHHGKRPSRRKGALGFFRARSYFSNCARGNRRLPSYT
jgi:hypothetical protein